MFETAEEFNRPESSFNRPQPEIANLISHRGIITEIESDVIRVSIIAESACASCHAKGFCSAADQKEKVIEARKPKSNSFKVGDNVLVTMKKVLGLQAVFYGYFFPFILLIITLLSTYEITGNQAIAGALCLLVLVPYYLTLYLMKEKLKSKFEFEIKS